MATPELDVAMRKLEELNCNIIRNNDLLVTKLEHLERSHEQTNLELRRRIDGLEMKVDELENRDRRSTLLILRFA